MPPRYPQDTPKILNKIECKWTTEFQVAGVRKFLASRLLYKPIIRTSIITIADPWVTKSVTSAVRHLSSNISSHLHRFHSFACFVTYFHLLTISLISFHQYSLQNGVHVSSSCFYFSFRRFMMHCNMGFC